LVALRSIFEDPGASEDPISGPISTVRSIDRPISDLCALGKKSIYFKPSDGSPPLDGSRRKDPTDIAQAHARAGCTYKTCVAVAAFTLRRYIWASSFIVEIK
jgi:hypothetical protein